MAEAIGGVDGVELVLVCPRPSDRLPQSVSEAIAEMRFLPEKRSRELSWHLGIQRPLVKHLATAHREGNLDALVSTLRPSLVVPPLFARWHGIQYRLLVEGALGQELGSVTDLPLARPVSDVVSILNVRTADRTFAVNEHVARWVSSLAWVETIPTILPHGSTVEDDSGTKRTSHIEGTSTTDENADGRPSDPLSAGGIPQAEFVVGYVGSFKPYHCLPTLLKAVACLRETGHDIGLRLIGTGPKYEEITSLAATLGIDDVTHFSGFVDPEEVSDYLEGVDVGYGVIPPDRAGSPMKVYDYLSCALPVIAFDDPEFQFIEQTEAGILVDEVSVDSVRNALEALANLPPEGRREMGARGRAYVQREGHSWGDVASEVLEGVM